MTQKTPEYALRLIAAALELRQSHGAYFVASFLMEQGIRREVVLAALELRASDLVFANRI